MILFRMMKNWRFDMISLRLILFYYIEKLIEWQNSQKAYKKQTLIPHRLRCYDSIGWPLQNVSFKMAKKIPIEMFFIWGSIQMGMGKQSRRQIRKVLKLQFPKIRLVCSAFLNEVLSKHYFHTVYTQNKRILPVKV